MLNNEEYNLYENSIGKVFCYPAFTKATINSDFDFSQKYEDFGEGGNEDVLFIINFKYQNGYATPAISLEEFSDDKEDKEYLFPPFSFFKITNVESNEGNSSDPHKIYLEVTKMQKSIEDMFLVFLENKSEYLNPEGLDMIKCDINNNKIYFNQEFMNI